MSRVLAAAERLYPNTKVHWVRVGNKEYLFTEEGEILLSRSSENINFGTGVDYLVIF